MKGEAVASLWVFLDGDDELFLEFIVARDYN
jgi:hypothetical protein